MNSTNEVMKKPILLMDDEELASLTRASPKLKGVPIIFLTAAVTKGEIEARGGKLGGFPFVAKPVVLAEVLACLKHHLGEAEAAQHSGNP